MFHKTEDAGLKHTMQNDKDVVTDINVKDEKKLEDQVQF